MYINLIVTFKGEGFNIEESTKSAPKFLELFHAKKIDALFITIEQRGLHDKEKPPIVIYTIYDTRTKEDLYGHHTIVTTNASGKKPAEVFQLSNSCNLNTFGLILRRDYKKISFVLKKIEKKYVGYHRDERSVFTDHPDNNMFTFGISLLFGLGGVEDRPPKHH